MLLSHHYIEAPEKEDVHIEVEPTRLRLEKGPKPGPGPEQGAGGGSVMDKKKQEELRKQRMLNYYNESITPHALSNLSFVLTGKLSMVRDLVLSVIHKHGGYVQRAVDENTNFLVMGSLVGNNKTSKVSHDFKEKIRTFI